MTKDKQQDEPQDPSEAKAKREKLADELQDVRKKAKDSEDGKGFKGDASAGATGPGGN